MVNSSEGAVQLTMFMCQWCGKPLPKGRADMKCHKSCRQALYRWKKRREKYERDAIEAIGALLEYTYPMFSRDEAIQSLKAVNQRIMEVYQIANIRRVS